MPPRVRPATPADASALAAVQSAAWRRAYRGLLDDAYLEGLHPPVLVGGWEAVIHRIRTAAPCEALLVAEAGGVAGYCHVGPAESDPTRVPGRSSGEVFSLYVHPRVWGRGLGRTLLARAEAGLAAAGFAWGVLWVLEANARARAFYEAVGWRPDGGRQQDYLGGRSYPLVRYVRPLVMRSPSPRAGAEMDPPRQDGVAVSSPSV